MLKTILSIAARTAQIIGLATITYVVILFFGKTDMMTLLILTIIGVVEFYTGYAILLFFEKREAKTQGSEDAGKFRR